MIVVLLREKLLRKNGFRVKFIYSEKATKFCEIFTVDLSYVVPVKSTVEISKNFVGFSEFMNFNSVVLNPPKKCDCERQILR